MNGFKDHHPKCVKCGSKCNYEYVASVPQVILKDGPSGSWPSKGERIKKQRREASEKAARRQRDRYGTNHAVLPNVGGKETGTWAEAQNVILKERGPEAAATFETKVKREKSANKTIKIHT
jgi:hypothetical protein